MSMTSSTTESKKEGPFRPSSLLSDPVRLSDFFELLEEVTEPPDQLPVFADAQVDLAFTPEAQQSASCVWTYPLESDSDCFVSISFSHDVFAFLPKLTRQTTPTEGGGPVKRFLTTGQQCLFPTVWFSRAGGK